MASLRRLEVAAAKEGGVTTTTLDAMAGMRRTVFLPSDLPPAISPGSASVASPQQQPQPVYSVNSPAPEPLPLKTAQREQPLMQQQPTTAQPAAGQIQPTLPVASSTRAQGGSSPGHERLPPTPLPQRSPVPQPPDAPSILAAEPGAVSQAPKPPPPGPPRTMVIPRRRSRFVRAVVIAANPNMIGYVPPTKDHRQPQTGLLPSAAVPAPTSPSVKMSPYSAFGPSLPGARASSPATTSPSSLQSQKPRQQQPGPVSSPGLASASSVSAPESIRPSYLVITSTRSTRSARTSAASALDSSATAMPAKPAKSSLMKILNPVTSASHAVAAQDSNALAEPAKTSSMKTSTPVTSGSGVETDQLKKEGDAEAARTTGPLPQLLPSPEASDASIDDVASSIEGETADMAPAKAPKKKPAWMGNWGKGGAVNLAVSSATPAAKAVNIITGEALAPASPSMKQLGVIGSGWGKDRAAAASSSRSGGGSGPRMVMRDGSWQLEGHEEDMAGLAEATPTLQARLLGGVKAEQVGGKIVIIL